MLYGINTYLWPIWAPNKLRVIEIWSFYIIILLKIPICERQRTYAIARHNIKKDILTEFDYQVGQHLKAFTENSELDIDYLTTVIYSAQLAYSRLTAKRNVRADWQRPLNDKIQANERLIKVIEKKRNNQSVTKSERRAIKQVCSSRERDPKRGMELDIVRDSLIQENEAIQTRIRLSKERIEFSRQNYLFETKRGKFYREIEEKNIIGHELDGKEDEILKFWKDQWLPGNADGSWNELLTFPI